MSANTLYRQRQAVGAEVLLQLEQKGMSNAKLAERLGVDKTLVHRVKNGVWAGISEEKLMNLSDALGIKNEDLEMKQMSGKQNQTKSQKELEKERNFELEEQYARIAAAAEAEEKKEAEHRTKALKPNLSKMVPDWKIRKTANFQIVQNLCERAKLYKKFYAISAFTGAGKTTALKHFADKYPSVHYVRIGKFDGLKGMLTKIQVEIGYIRGSSVSERIRMIGRKLRESGKMLILDDMHKVPDNSYHFLYDIYEELNGEVPLVISGTESLKKKIDDRCRLNVEGFRELNRRIVYWEKLQAPASREILTILNDYGISDKGAQQYIINRAENYGVLKNMVTTAVAVAAREKVSVTREILADIQHGSY